MGSPGGSRNPSVNPGSKNRNTRQGFKQGTGHGGHRCLPAGVEGGGPSLYAPVGGPQVWARAWPHPDGESVSLCTPRGRPGRSGKAFPTGKLSLRPLSGQGAQDPGSPGVGGNEPARWHLGILNQSQSPPGTPNPAFHASHFCSDPLPGSQVHGTEVAPNPQTAVTPQVLTSEP